LRADERPWGVILLLVEQYLVFAAKLPAISTLWIAVRFSTLVPPAISTCLRLAGT
jgi:hypothetical protein